MHTTKLGELAIAHNGDWSGDAILFYRDKELTVPAQELLALVNAAAREKLKTEIISFIEDL